MTAARYRVERAAPDAAYDALTRIWTANLRLESDAAIKYAWLYREDGSQAAEQKFWRDAMLGNRVSDTDLAYATKLLREYGAIEDTIDRARHYGQRAIDAIAHFSGGEAKAALTEAVEFAIARAY